ncbi:MAG: amino acid adenylation domain-containing protein [Roseburia sp.]|nr:amino acid adenylation domain-containing protein [Roseburia sp.]MCM1097059.1 amino acid adenylation domain-containing protein [Ruminococcus flavefaciens]
MQNHVLDYLNRIVKEKPDKVAFADDSEALTFLEVYRQSRAVGSFLCKKGIYKQPVVVFMNKHPREIAAFFGVIAGGDFYVPIDEEMPRLRIELILKNVRSPLLICDSKTESIAREFDFQGEIALYDEIAETPAEDGALQEIYDRAIDTDPIYIVFTSGSTGVPKGVAACHRSVIDYIEQLSETLGFDENTVFGNQTPLYFDACLKELYPTLKFGATTWLIPKSLFLFPIKLVEYLNEKKINTICWVVSALTMISAFDTFRTVKPEYLRTVAFGSEVFPIRQFRRWREALPQAGFTNLYGPTEGTGMCCFYKVEREFEENEAIPIGRPFPNTEILLLTEENKRAEAGETGEICIRGTSVTLGYYNNFKKTGEVFVQNPLNTAYPEIIYRTGDLARYNERGELVFVSRKDYQIKHMGHRIELGEIEANVNQLEEIQIAACIYDDRKNRIVLYYVGDIREGELAGMLKKRLPRYMIPNSIIRREEMLFTANGKVDRKSLKAAYQGQENKEEERKA